MRLSKADIERFKKLLEGCTMVLDYCDKRDSCSGCVFEGAIKDEDDECLIWALSTIEGSLIDILEWST